MFKWPASSSDSCTNGSGTSHDVETGEGAASNGPSEHDQVSSSSCSTEQAVRAADQGSVPQSPAAAGVAVHAAQSLCSGEGFTPTSLLSV